MPELPEVETIARDLREVLIGQKLLRFEAAYSAAFKPNSGVFSALKGKKLQKIERHGKFLNFFFTDDLVMTIHLRMTGQLLLTKEKQLYERARFVFEKNTLIFADLRKFGRIWLCVGGDYREKTGICSLATDAIDPAFTSASFLGALMGKKGTIKKHLLSQQVVAGVGNIYADEALFSAGVRPDRQVASLSDEEIARLYTALRTILLAAVERRGTSFSDYLDGRGHQGGYLPYLQVYGRGGEKCLVCGGILQKIRLEGRGTVLCERCQK